MQILKLIFGLLNNVYGYLFVLFFYLSVAAFTYGFNTHSGVFVVSFLWANLYSIILMVISFFFGFLALKRTIQK